MSRPSLARALALCDAAKLRLPTLEQGFARGLFAAHHTASEPYRKDVSISGLGLTSRSCAKDAVLPTKTGPSIVSSVIQSRKLSSEGAFREYGRNFSNDEASTGGPELNDAQFASATMPEGLNEDDGMDDEQQESEDEVKMRQQLLKAALSHVVRSDVYFEVGTIIPCKRLLDP